MKKPARARRCTAFRPMLGDGLLGAHSLEGKRLASAFTESGVNPAVLWGSAHGGFLRTNYPYNTEIYDWHVSATQQGTSTTGAGAVVGNANPPLNNFGLPTQYSGQSLTQIVTTADALVVSGMGSASESAQGYGGSTNATGNNFGDGQTAGSGNYFLSAPAGYTSLQVTVSVSTGIPAVSDSRFAVQDYLNFYSNLVDVTVGVGAPYQGVRGISIYSPTTSYSTSNTTFGSTGSGQGTYSFAVPLNSSSFNFSYVSSAAIAIKDGSVVAVGSSISGNVGINWSVTLQYLH